MYPSEYIQYLVHFHGDRDYFECHEILEDYWKRQDFGNKQSLWTGLILLAVSCYHHRRSNFSGAKKTLEKAITILINEKNCLKSLGINHHELFELLNSQLAIISNKEPYKGFNLPITDPLLIEDCNAHCSRLGYIWCSNSDLSDRSIVHRHKLRDRTKIIQARNQAHKSKKGGE